MKKGNWILFIFACFAMAFQSCSDDNVVNEDQELQTIENFEADSAIAERPGQGNPRGGTPVDRMDTDVLNSWTSLILDLDKNAFGMRPNATARAIAYIYLTAYETGVPGMRGFESTSRFLDQLNIRAPRETRDLQYELALNNALSIVTKHFLFTLDASDQAKIQNLERSNERVLSRNQSRRTIDASKSWGQQVASQIIAYSQTDQEAEAQILEPQPLSYEPPTGLGYWTYSAEPERALFPYWGSVRTFAIGPDETTTIVPEEYSTNSNSNYYAQMMEVYTENNAAKANQGEQLHIAEFWSDDVEGLMMSPPMRQVSILNQLVAEHELNLEEALVIHLKLGFSLNDAAVSTWKYKYQYMVMRPSNYIHEFIDPDFQTNLYRLVYWPNPSFPGYPSGHSCFASAAAGIFIDFFGNNINFTDKTHEGRTEFLGEPRTFNTFTEMADENGYSRIPLGVHIKMDCTEGLRLGYEISDAVNDLRLGGRPNG